MQFAGKIPQKRKKGAVSLSEIASSSLPNPLPSQVVHHCSQSTGWRSRSHMSGERKQDFIFHQVGEPIKAFLINYIPTCHFSRNAQKTHNERWSEENEKPTFNNQHLPFPRSSSTFHNHQRIISFPPKHRAKWRSRFHIRKKRTCCRFLPQCLPSVVYSEVSSLLACYCISASPLCGIFTLCLCHLEPEIC